MLVTELKGKIVSGRSLSPKTQIKLPPLVPEVTHRHPLVHPSALNLMAWAEENKDSFNPPVCNKLMYKVRTGLR